MDAAVTVLHANKDKWINLTIDHKVKILDQIVIDLNEVAGDWVSISLREKWPRMKPILPSGSCPA